MEITEMAELPVQPCRDAYVVFGIEKIAGAVIAVRQADALGDGQIVAQPAGGEAQ